MAKVTYGDEDVFLSKGEALNNQISQFETMGDIDNWIDANFTDTQTKAALKAIARLLWSHEKRIRNLERGD